MSLELERHYNRTRMLRAIAEKRMTTAEKLEIAQQKYRQKCNFAGFGYQRPRVTVFKSKTGSQITYVLRIGNRFQSARSWDNLIHNAAFAPWHLWPKSIYAKRMEKARGN